MDTIPNGHYYVFNAGATLSRGVNRAVATFLSATLAFGAHHLAVLSGEESEPVFIGLFVFLIAGMVTFARFFPRMKKRYDYGLLIFILTFCLISVSGYGMTRLILQDGNLAMARSGFGFPGNSTSRSEA
ncbi:hypothetical protein OIU77_028148 [Salix suchowensis]|uniref:Uncharacterized protein n=1 Tax=Salix suchowensis TaxID=1278906 RepID=A0ABQ9BK39_9ROSI|nr:hypothetical protein OIU77_028148 [Salix suchowensis]